MIKRIKVNQYRCFHSLELELMPHHVLAGANGSGKSTLLDIPTLFAELLATNETRFSLNQPQARAAPELKIPLS